MAESDRIGGRSGEMPNIGDAVKVWLPGETPWATCIAVNDDGTFQGRIDNWLFAQRTEKERAEAIQAIQPQWGGGAPLPSLHNYRQHDIVCWKWEAPIWKPAEPPPTRA